MFQCWHQCQSLTSVVGAPWRCGVLTTRRLLKRGLSRCGRSSGMSKRGFIVQRRGSTPDLTEPEKGRKRRHAFVFPFQTRPRCSISGLVLSLRAVSADLLHPIVIVFCSCLRLGTLTLLYSDVSAAAVNIGLLSLKTVGAETSTRSLTAAIDALSPGTCQLLS